MATEMFSELEEQRIVRAIANAERDNRGEVQVRVERRCPGNPLVRAKALYNLAGLAGTQDDTGVLLYIASQSRVSAVYAGAGVHARAEATFWQGEFDDGSLTFVVSWAKGEGNHGAFEMVMTKQ